MFDHLGIEVGDYPRSRTFHTATLAPPGVGLVTGMGEWAGFAAAGATPAEIRVSFWIHQGCARPAPGRYPDGHNIGSVCHAAT